MILTSAQQLTLKTAVQADPVLSIKPQSNGGALEIADAMNLTDATWTVWKTQVFQDTIMQNGFDWTRVDNMSVGKARIWEWMFDNTSKAFNPSKLNVRAGIDAAWVGTAADLAQRAAVYVHCKRMSNRIEKLLSTGTGTDASPATLTVEGTLTYLDVFAAMGW